MSRVIKFRAWYDGKMIYQNDYNTYTNWEILRLCNNAGGIYNKDKKWIVGIPQQFTGLLDKNNKEIYEGDIVSTVLFTCEKENGIVVFSNGAFEVSHNLFSNLSLGTCATIEGNVDNFEIIGNIYETPHLINYD